MRRTSLTPPVSWESTLGSAGPGACGSLLTQTVTMPPSPTRPPPNGVTPLVVVAGVPAIVEGSVAVGSVVPVPLVAAVLLDEDELLDVALGVAVRGGMAPLR